MNYKKKTLQLIYSSYEQMVETKKVYLNSVELFIIISDDPAGNILSQSIGRWNHNTIIISCKNYMSSLTNLIKNNSEKKISVIFPYQIDGGEGQLIEQSDMIEIIKNGMEYFAYILDETLVKESLFDIGSNGMSLALDLLHGDSDKILYYHTYRMICKDIDEQLINYEDIITEEVKLTHFIWNASEDYFKTEQILNEIIPPDIELSSEKTKYIIPLGYCFSSLWKIPIYIKQRLPLVKMRLIQGGNRFNQTYLMIQQE